MEPGPSDCSWALVETHRSCNSLHLVHSERGKVIVLPFVLLKGLVCEYSVEFSILKEVKEYRAVFSIGQCRRDWRKKMAVLGYWVGNSNVNAGTQYM